ncbi:MAG: U32 family peptidase [Candidatus Cloacimonetes bacterium]|nr:U32 family peptidase [Candidatus Cloacimonadota bacterium]
MKKTELLLPVGNVEAFYAALEGGADAIYLGLRQFNARERARNFTFSQYKAILQEAARKNVKVYLTLNTLIKNSELPELLDILSSLTQNSPAAVIIQDLGVLHLIRKYFPQLKIHASTQMAHHNSSGARFAEKLGFERVILARELSYEELTLIKKNSSIELEIFIHGALCYSFSGMCLFSSFLGGMSANRGNCRQPCRRKYTIKSQENYAFNLKDNQQTDLLKKLQKLGIASFKIEGRMKSAEYVFNTAQAYRQLLDEPRSANEARQLLNYDLGREKTSYFMGGNVSEAISEFPYTGLKIGNVTSVKPRLKIFTEHEINSGDRIRILSSEGFDTQAHKIKTILYNGKDISSATEDMEIELPDIKDDCQNGDSVFLVGTSGKNFPSQMKNFSSDNSPAYPLKKKQAVLKDLAQSRPSAKEELFFRINSPNWLRKLFLNNIDRLIINFSLTELAGFDLKSLFWQSNIQKLIIQLPRFISEKNIPDWQKEISRLAGLSINNFMLSHLSQKLLFKDFRKVNLYTSENVYALNDAAITLLMEEGILNWIFPFENDYPNLLAGNDRRGIVPLFFYPELFFSRMPVKIPDEAMFADNRQNFIKKSDSGMTIVIPQYPVSLLQFHKRLYDKNFRRFLIDLSWTNSSSNTFNRLLKLFNDSQPEQPASTFNFKMGLK